MSAPLPEQIALINSLIAEQQRECVAHDRHATHSPELSAAKWRRLRTLRAVRTSIERWRQVVMLKSDLAAVVTQLHPEPLHTPEEDIHAAGH